MIVDQMENIIYLYYIILYIEQQMRFQEIMLFHTFGRVKIQNNEEGLTEIP